MNDLEDRIRGKKIIDILKIHDYLQIIFEEKVILNLYNKTSSFAKEDFLGYSAEIILDDNRQLVVKSKNDVELFMSLFDQDYDGPEAFSFHDSDGTTIVG